LRHRIQKCNPPGNIRANDGVADAIECDLSAFFLGEQCLVHGFALNGVSQRTKQSSCFDLSLEQVVLSAFLQRLRRKRLIVQPGKHHQWDARRSGMGPAYGLHTLCIRQAQIEHDDIDNMLCKMRLGVAHGGDV